MSTETSTAADPPRLTERQILAKQLYGVTYVELLDEARLMVPGSALGKGPVERAESILRNATAREQKAARHLALQLSEGLTPHPGEVETFTRYVGEWSQVWQMTNRRRRQQAAIERRRNEGYPVYEGPLRVDELVIGGDVPMEITTPSGEVVSLVSDIDGGTSRLDGKVNEDVQRILDELERLRPHGLPGPDADNR